MQQFVVVCDFKLFHVLGAAVGGHTERLDATVCGRVCDFKLFHVLGAAVRGHTERLDATVCGRV